MVSGELLQERARISLANGRPWYNTGGLAKKVIWQLISSLFGTRSMALQDYSSCQVAVLFSLGLWLRSGDSFPFLLFSVCLVKPCLIPYLPTLPKAVPSLSFFFQSSFLELSFLPSLCLMQKSYITIKNTQVLKTLTGVFVLVFFPGW